MVREADLERMPRRTCVGCRTVRHQAELVRIARAGDGNLRVGRTLPGRGAWLCRDHPGCLERAVATGGFNRAFRTSIGPEQVVGLRREMQDGSPEV